jgi:putative SOS response-associated peptidase YedK
VPGAHIGKDSEMRLDTYRWGFVPNWVRNLAEFKLTTINARAESVAKAKTYAAAFRRHRLLVAADSFFECFPGVVIAALYNINRPHHSCGVLNS